MLGESGFVNQRDVIKTRELQMIVQDLITLGVNMNAQAANELNKLGISETDCPTAYDNSKTLNMKDFLDQAGEEELGAVKKRIETLLEKLFPEQ